MGAWHCENACFPQKYDFSQDWGKTSRIFSTKLSFLDILGRKTHRISPKTNFSRNIGGKYERISPPKTQIFENLGESTVTWEQNFFAKK
jgi:hypothetical protein